MTLAKKLAEEVDNRKVRLQEAHIEHIYDRVRKSQRSRYLDWLHRHENMAANREYRLPKISEFYHRVLINQAEREALHVTRRTIDAITRHTIRGSQGYVAEWAAVMRALAARAEEPGTPGYDSLQACKKLMGRYAYNISEGPSFIRTPLILPVLERKYYVDDLEQY